MATVTFDSSDPLAEAGALISLLSEFLKDHPQQPRAAATARFEYAEDGSLRTVVVTLAEAGEK